MEKSIAILGPIKQSGREGKTNPKIFIYQKAFESLGYKVSLYSTNVSKINVFGLLNNIWNALSSSDIVVLMLGGNACRKLLPIILTMNKKRKRRLVLAPFGTGPLNPLLSKKTSEFSNKFIQECDFGGMKDKKSVSSSLAKIDCILVQTNTLKKCFEKFYSLSNVEVLPNFRIVDEKSENKTIDIPTCDLSIVFISRVCKEKGILDLTDAINTINHETRYKIYLGIFGSNNLLSEERDLFQGIIDYSSSLIKYYGPIENKYVHSIIEQFDYACLPTKHNGEGAPGFVIESLIAGTPVILSSFSQSHDLISDKKDGLIFEIDNKESLKKTLLFAIENKAIIGTMKDNARLKGKSFSFENNRELIAKVLEG